MKRILFLLAALWITVPSFATMQFPERLIVGSDTLLMFTYPLNYAGRTVLKRLDARLKAANAPICSGCWRGYVGCWRLEEGQLWLEQLVSIDDEPLFTAAELFPKRAEGGRVRASWFSGEICYGRGEMVFVWDRCFYEEEWTASVKAGRVGQIRSFRNWVSKRCPDVQENVRRVSEAFHDLGPVDSLPSPLLLSVRFVPDSTGRPVRIKRARLTMGNVIIQDFSDPLLQRACKAFREASVWDVAWIHGEIHDWNFILPLRRNEASSRKASE